MRLSAGLARRFAGRMAECTLQYGEAGSAMYDITTTTTMILS